MITFLKLPATLEKPRFRSGTSNKSSSTTSKEGIGMASRTEAEAIVTFGTQGAHARLQKKELSQSKSYKIQGHSRSKNLRTKIKGDFIISHLLINSDRLTIYQKTRRTQMNTQKQVKSRQNQENNLGKAQRKLTYENITYWRVLTS